MSDLSRVIAEALNLLQCAGVDVDIVSDDQKYSTGVDLIEVRLLENPLGHYVYYHYGEWVARDE